MPEMKDEAVLGDGAEQVSVIDDGDDGGQAEVPELFEPYGAKEDNGRDSSHWKKYKGRPDPLYTFLVGPNREVLKITASRLSRSSVLATRSRKQPVETPTLLPDDSLSDMQQVFRYLWTGTCRGLQSSDPFNCQAFTHLAPLYLLALKYAIPDLEDDIYRRMRPSSFHRTLPQRPLPVHEYQKFIDTAKEVLPKVPKRSRLRAAFMTNVRRAMRGIAGGGSQRQKRQCERLFVGCVRDGGMVGDVLLRAIVREGLQSKYW